MVELAAWVVVIAAAIYVLPRVLNFLVYLIPLIFVIYGVFIIDGVDFNLPDGIKSFFACALVIAMLGIVVAGIWSFIKGFIEKIREP
ncbi:hypothetical protein [Vibrio sp. 1288]|uniref:hypothetical protein n=1 Tax=Vibrio sp. 1288 TaxID=3074550 RepID=UPI0029677879|nr:hypothetical protein [Vibrio sp. 1288]MDW3135562.1 hypothetical protein [Vibrio sp. 1288]